MNKRLIFFCISIGLLASFYLFSKQVRHGFLKQADFNTTVKLQDKIPARFDEIMDDGAILADAFISSAIVLGLTVWIFVDRKKTNLRWGALVILIAFVGMGLIEIYGKNMLPHPGPPFFMVKQPTTIFPKFHVVQPYSYPSGHAARSTFLAIITGALIIERFAKNHQKKTLMLAAIAGYTLFVWVSRIYLGHHWLSDIVGGVLLGASTSLAAVGVLNLLFRGSIIQKQ